jgi:hypothetical protein
MRYRSLIVLACVLSSCTKSDDESQASPPSGQAEQTTAAAPVAAQPKSPAASRKLDCGASSSSRITATGIGDLQVGRTVAAVKQLCNVTRDAAEPGYEGMTERILTVALGADMVRAAIVEGLVWRVTITQPRFATPDGLRVGTPLSDLISEKGVRIAEGEDGPRLMVPTHCGLSFHFSIQSRSPSGVSWTAMQLRRQHSAARVDRILVTRCLK